MKVAFATYQKSPLVDADDGLAANVLQSRGISVTSAVWDDQKVDWAGFDCVVIRSTWDYHQKSSQFADWLRWCASKGVRLWNRPHVVLDNMNKRYLTDLAGRGVEIVPTKYVTAGSKQTLRQVLEENQWDHAVIKPAISAGAFGTWRTSLTKADMDQPDFEQQSQSHAILVQPYMSEIEKGEWSLIFFDSVYSHAVFKRPAVGDFRVQSRYSGAAGAANPSQHLIKQAGDILAKVNSPLLYARVDGIEQAGRFVLMELEIIEPYLFLGYSPQAPIRFADAIEMFAKPP